MNVSYSGLRVGRLSLPTPTSEGELHAGRGLAHSPQLAHSRQPGDLERPLPVSTVLWAETGGGPAGAQLLRHPGCGLRACLLSQFTASHLTELRTEIKGRKESRLPGRSGLLELGRAPPGTVPGACRALGPPLSSLSPQTQGPRGAQRRTAPTPQGLAGCAGVFSNPGAPSELTPPCIPATQQRGRADTRTRLPGCTRTQAFIERGRSARIHLGHRGGCRRIGARPWGAQAWLALGLLRARPRPSREWCLSHLLPSAPQTADPGSPGLCPGARAPHGQGAQWCDCQASQTVQAD